MFLIVLCTSVVRFSQQTLLNSIRRFVNVGLNKHVPQFVQTDIAFTSQTTTVGRKLTDLVMARCNVLLVLGRSLDQSYRHSCSQCIFYFSLS
jgi:hypothetical protein